MMPGTLDELRRKSPLPSGWSLPEVVEDTILADGITLRRAGLSTRGAGGAEALGAAAEIMDSPIARSYFELLERVVLLDAMHEPQPSYRAFSFDGRSMGRRSAAVVFPESGEPARWRFARSNGVALHEGWENACRRAAWELIERDRVLRSWYGELQPEPLPFPTRSPCSETKSYDWRAYGFPRPANHTLGDGVLVAGVFGFPLHPSAPLALGFGARATLDDAVDAAAREAMQQLAFLWGEPIPQEPPVFAPTPLYHIERFQCPSQHAVLRQWLDGEHTRHQPKLDSPLDGTVSFVDLTPSWLSGGLRVVKALCPAAVSLAFGDPPYARHLPEDLRAHPIG